MTLDLSRRGFLKGLMAAAGVAAVGVTVPAAVEVVEAAVAPAVPLPPVEMGDLWVKVDGVYEFMGKIGAWEMRYPDVISFADCRADEHLDIIRHPYSFRADGFSEFGAVGAFHDTIMTPLPDKIDVLMGTFAGTIEQTVDVRFAEMETPPSPRMLKPEQSTRTELYRWTIHAEEIPGAPAIFHPQPKEHNA